jgi:hypothetical protein
VAGNGKLLRASKSEIEIEIEMENEALMVPASRVYQQLA